MKRHISLLLLLLITAPLAAQSRREALLEYQARRRQAYTEFRDNYRKACAEFMRKRWEAFRSESPVPLPDRKEPDRPVVKQPEAPVIASPIRIPSQEIIDLPQPTPAAPEQPTQPTRPHIDTKRSCRFTFYGTACSVTLRADSRVKLSSLQENSVADAWERIASGAYDQAARECAELKEALCLNDWGYYRLVWTLGDAFCGAGTDESVLVQSFLMTEAGYKVRLARGENRLCLLVAIDEQVYSRPYFRIDGSTFYLLDNTRRATSYHICNFSIQGEKVLTLSMPESPLLTEKPGRASVHNVEPDGIRTTVTTNQNLIDFMADYPPCYWNIYATTPLSAGVRDQLLPALRRATAGKSEREAAGILLNYLHKAFEYKTDNDQFGEERTLFAEEMFHFPYSDCEDRSILYVRLIRQVLGLKTVLLYYPNHIATAVRFNAPETGDYVEVDGERYIVCDPTYIGAEVGEAMPDMKQLSAQIIRID